MNKQELIEKIEARNVCDLAVSDSFKRGFNTMICEIKDCIYFENDEIAGTQETYSYQINHGDKIAQLIIQPLPPVDLEEVDELDDTDRGVGGFGSTGV